MYDIAKFVQCHRGADVSLSFKQVPEEWPASDDVGVTRYRARAVALRAAALFVQPSRGVSP